MVYLLYYDTDTGNREDWSTFYTPVEAFSSPGLRNDRIQELRLEGHGYDFHIVDIEVK